MWNLSLCDGPIESRAFLGLDAEGAPIFGDLLPVYNINLAVSCYTPELAPYVVEPARPKRVFMGDDPSDRSLTICLSFPDEATAKQVLAQYWTDDQ